MKKHLIHNLVNKLPPDETLEKYKAKKMAEEKKRIQIESSDEEDRTNQNSDSDSSSEESDDGIDRARSRFSYHAYIIYII